jgi:hypothetical protein
MEHRLFGTTELAVQNGAANPSLPKFLPEKVITDLTHGYRIVLDDDEIHYSGLVLVVTKLDQDLFHVQSSHSLLKTHPQRPFRYDAEVRRRQLIWPQPTSATKEVWTARVSTLVPLNQTYRIQADNGGELEEPAFWRSYNLSQVDPDLTEQQLESYLAIMDKRRRRRAKVSRIADKILNDQLDEPLIS